MSCVKPKNLPTQPTPTVGTAHPPPAAPRQPTTTAPRTWAQVVAGPAQPRHQTPRQVKKATPQTVSLDEIAQLAHATLEKKTMARLAALEKKLEQETAARVEQGAKIDAIFEFVQKASAPPCPATPHTGRDEPAKKRSKPCRQGSQDVWVTLPQEEGALQECSDGEPRHSKKGHGGQHGRGKSQKAKEGRTAGRKKSHKRRRS